MANHTPVYGFEKPLQDEDYNVDVFNRNADTADEALANKANIVISLDQIGIAPGQETMTNIATAINSYTNGVPCTLIIAVDTSYNATEYPSPLGTLIVVFYNIYRCVYHFTAHDHSAEWVGVYELSSGWSGWKQSLLVNRVLESTLTLYVSPSGNDAQADGSLENPYQTINAAVQYGAQCYQNMGQYRVTVSLMDGTYNEDVTVSGSFGFLNIIGYSGNKANVVVNGRMRFYDVRASIQSLTALYNPTSNSDAVVLFEFGTGFVRDCTISRQSGTTPTGPGLWCGYGAQVYALNVEVNYMLYAFESYFSGVLHANGSSGTGNTYGYYAVGLAMVSGTRPGATTYALVPTGGIISPTT